MKTTIYYFSGTGNSLWLAKQLAEALGGATLASIKADTEFDTSAETIGFVFPVHLWRAPRIVEDFAAKIPECPNAYFFSAANYKSDIGNCSEQFARLIGKKNRLSAAFEIQMPGNNIIYYSAESKNEQREKLKNAKKAVAAAAKAIKARGKLIPPKIGLMGKIKSAAISSALTKTFAAGDKNFFTTDSCKGCGLCEKICPVSNIKIVEGKPVWGHSCAQCVGCINACPSTAIEYGKTTAKKERYINPEIGVDELL